MLRWLLVIVALILLTGCGNGMVRVQGEVLLDDKPLPGANILLMPKSGGRPASAKSDASGKFQLTTLRPGDGILPGDYLVSVTAIDEKNLRYEPNGRAEGGFAEQHRRLAPERYGDIKTSGLTATISATDPRLSLRLVSTP